MYLHLGGGSVVPVGSIVAMFDIENTTQSHITRKYLAMAEKSGQVINAAEDLPRSFVVCSDERGVRVYLSQLSTSTLEKRI